MEGKRHYHVDKEGIVKMEINGIDLGHLTVFLLASVSMVYSFHKVLKEEKCKEAWLTSAIAWIIVMIYSSFMFFANY